MTHIMKIADFGPFVLTNLECDLCQKLNHFRGSMYGVSAINFGKIHKLIVESTLLTKMITHRHSRVHIQPPPDGWLLMNYWNLMVVTFLHVSLSALLEPLQFCSSFTVVYFRFTALSRWLTQRRRSNAEKNRSCDKEFSLCKPWGTYGNVYLLHVCCRVCWLNNLISPALAHARVCRLCLGLCGGRSGAAGSEIWCTDGLAVNRRWMTTAVELVERQTTPI